MTNARTTITCDLTAKTITIDGLAAMRETVDVVLQNHGAYTSTDLKAIVSFERAELLRCEAFAVAGSDLQDELDFDAAAVIASFPEGRQGAVVLKFGIKVWAWASSTVIASAVLPVMNNPYNPSMEAPVPVS